MVDALSIVGGGGSVGRAVAHYSDPNVSVLRTAHFVRRTEQRIVGTFHFDLSKRSFTWFNLRPANHGDPLSLAE